MRNWKKCPGSLSYGILIPLEIFPICEYSVDQLVAVVHSVRVTRVHRLLWRTADAPRIEHSIRNRHPTGKLENPCGSNTKHLVSLYGCQLETNKVGEHATLHPWMPNADAGWKAQRMVHYFGGPILYWWNFVSLSHILTVRSPSLPLQWWAHCGQIRRELRFSEKLVTPTWTQAPAKQHKIHQSKWL